MPESCDTFFVDFSEFRAGRAIPAGGRRRCRSDRSRLRRVPHACEGSRAFGSGVLETRGRRRGATARAAGRLVRRRAGGRVPGAIKELGPVCSTRCSPIRWATCTRGKGRSIRWPARGGHPSPVRCARADATPCGDFLYLPAEFIAQSTDTPMVRTLDVASAGALIVKLRLRILGITSSPSGYQHLDAGRAPKHGDCANRAGGRGCPIFLVGPRDPDVLARVSERDEIHVIHYIGHGAYSRGDRVRHPCAGDTRGRAHDVRARRSVRCAGRAYSSTVVLNSCDGARPRTSTPSRRSEEPYRVRDSRRRRHAVRDHRPRGLAFSGGSTPVLAQGMPLTMRRPRPTRIMAHDDGSRLTGAVPSCGVARLFDIVAHRPSRRPVAPQWQLSPKDRKSLR